MTKRLMGLQGMVRRFGLYAACALPAFGIGIHTPRANFVATYISACQGTGVAPSVRIQWASAARHTARPRSSSVEVYPRGRSIDRTYDVLGEVGVLAHSSHTGVDVLSDYAQRTARKMGGDAIIDVWYDDAASVRPKAGEQGMLYLTARVVRWQPSASAPAPRADDRRE